MAGTVATEEEVDATAHRTKRQEAIFGLIGGETIVAAIVRTAVNEDLHALIEESNRGGVAECS